MVKILEFLKKNLIVMAAVFLIVAIVIGIYGCQPQVASLVESDKRVSRAEFDAEVAYLSAKIQAKYAELDKQEAIVKTIVEQLQLFGQNGGINPAGLFNVGLSIVAIGYGIQKSQQLSTANKQIVKLKNGSTATVV